jgi:hypothetical protein
MENQEIFNMACNPVPEVLAPMRVMQQPKQKAKRNETKNSEKLCEKRARAHEQRGQKRAFFSTQWNL